MNYDYPIETRSGWIVVFWWEGYQPNRIITFTLKHDYSQGAGVGVGGEWAERDLIGIIECLFCFVFMWWGAINNR